MLIFSVYDSKAEAFGAPIFVDTVGLALRSFQAAVADERSELHRFSEDFTLFELGSFDRKDGSFVLHPAPRSVVRAAVVLEQMKNQEAK